MAGRINSIDAKITINASQAKGELARITSDLQKFNKAFQSGAPQLQSFTKQTEAATVKLAGLQGSVVTLTNSFQTLMQAGNMLKTVMGGAYEYSTMLESNAIGISGILKSMVTLNGNTLEWNQSMAISKGIMEQLRNEAFKTAATSKDLIETFRALLGPGLGAGMKIDEIIKFTTVGVNAVRSMGLPANQYIQELRGLEQGGLRASSSTLATSLGLTDKDIKAAKASSEGLFKFLMDRMEGFAASNEATSKSVVGRIAILQEGIYSSMTEGGKDLYNQFSNWLEKVSSMLYEINKEAGTVRLNPKFVEGINNFSASLQFWGSVGGKIFSGIASNGEKIGNALNMAFNTKLATLLLGNGVNFITGAKSKYDSFASMFRTDRVAEMNAEISKLYSEIGAIQERSQNIVKQNEQLSSILKNIDGGVKSLAEHYMSLGVSAEMAAKMQERVEKAMLEGKSYADINSLRRTNEDYALYVQKQARIIKYRDSVAEIEKKIVSLKEKQAKAEESTNAQKDRQIERIQKQIEKEEQNLSVLEKQKNVVNEKALTDSYKAAQQQLDAANKQAEAYAKGERTLNSITRLEERLVALGMDRATAEVKVASVLKEIEDLNKNDLVNGRDIVNQKVAEYEQEARNLSLAKEKERLSREALKNFDEGVKKNFQSFKNANADRNAKNSASRVENFLNGKGTHKKNGVDIAWTPEEVARGNEINKLLENANFSLKDRNRYMSEYLSILTRGSQKAAEAYAKGIENNVAEYKAEMERIEALKTYNTEIGKVIVSLNRFHEAESKEAQNSKILWIDAANNLDLYVRENGQGAASITKAWAKLSSSKEAGFQQEENRIKVLIALEKEMAAGHMDSALKIVEAYNKIYKEISKGKIAVEIDQKIVESTNKITEAKQKQTEAIQNAEAKNKESNERTTQLIEAQNEALRRLNDEYNRLGITRQELLGKSVKELTLDQRKILIKEAERNAISKCESSKQKDIEKTMLAVQKEAEAMEKAGLVGTEAYTNLMLVMNELAKVTEVDAEKIIEKLNEIISKTQKVRQEAEASKAKILPSLSAIGSAVGSVSFAYQILAHDTESSIGKFAEWGIQASFVISACESIYGAVMALAGAFGGLATTIGLTIPATVLSIKVAKNNYDELVSKYGKKVVDTVQEQALNDMIPVTDEMLQSELDKQSEEYKKKVGQDSESKAMAALKLTDYTAVRKKLRDTPKNGDFNLRFPKEDTVDKKAAKEAERLAKKLADAESSYAKLKQTIKITNGELTYSYTEFDKEYDSAIKKTLEWKKTLNEAFVNAGGKMDKDGNILSEGQITKERYDEIIAKIKEYLELKQREINLNQQYKEIENDLQHSQNQYDMQKINQQQLIDLQRKALEEKKVLIEREMQLYAEGSTKRIEKEKELSATLKEIRNNDMLDMKTAWKAALQEIASEQLNFGEGIKSVFSSIQSAGATLLSSTASFSEKVANFFNSITESILENMAKMIMQGLITNAILSVFGGGGFGSNLSGNINNVTNAGTNYLNGIGGATKQSGIISGGLLGFKANGGYASGWNIVGEQGPELVNFSNPARVYTAKQTANALSNANGSVNIKIDLHNESGTKVEAQTTGTSFDGESYVVGVVLKAIANNQNGMRNIIRGVATQ